MSAPICSPARTFISPHELQEAVAKLNLATEGKSTVRIQDKFRDLSRISAVVVIGSSGAGKTTLVNHVKRSYEWIESPLRYITRPIRKNDDTSENAHLPLTEFLEKTENGEISLHWVRQMVGKVEQYGFAKADPAKFTMYSGNNAIVDRITELGLDTILIIGIYAPDDQRRSRLQARSPDFSEAELSHRLGDSADNVFPLSHLVIDNRDENQARALDDFLALMGLMKV